MFQGMRDPLLPLISATWETAPACLNCVQKTVQPFLRVLFLLTIYKSLSAEHLSAQHLSQSSRCPT